MSCDRGGCPLYPEDGGAHPGLRIVLSRRLPLCHGQSFRPCSSIPSAGIRLTRHQRGFTRFTRPACPSPVAARMERAALGLPPKLHTPPTRSRRVTPGWGQVIEHEPETTHYDISRTSHPASSLITCDLASHRSKRHSAPDAVSAHFEAGVADAPEGHSKSADHVLPPWHLGVPKELVLWW
jgi:hypothetical protein